MGVTETKTTKEGRKLIKNYQKKSRNLTQTKDELHIRKLFNLYGGKKGYLDEREAKLFIKDILIVCGVEKDEILALTEAIFRELDPNNSNKLQYTQFIKPSWGKVQDLLHTVRLKMDNNPLTATTTTGGEGTPQHSTSTMSALFITTSATTTPTTTPMSSFTASTASSTASPSVGTPVTMIDCRLECLISLSELEDTCPPSFLCPISTEIMVDPVILLETKTTYDRKFIEEWLKNHSTDPSTGLELKSKEILPVLALKNAIEEWKTELKERKRKEKREEVEAKQHEWQEHQEQQEREERQEQKEQQQERQERYQQRHQQEQREQHEQDRQEKEQDQQHQQEQQDQQPRQEQQLQQQDQQQHQQDQQPQQEQQQQQQQQNHQEM